MFSVIFDMDGTLLDTQGIFVPAWDEMGARQGIQNLGSHVKFNLGKNEAGWKGYLAENFPTLDIETFTTQVFEYIAENLVVRYKKGAPELIAFLRENGVKIAVASGSSTEIIEHHLKKVGAEGVFDVLIGGEQVTNGKPAPDIFLLAAEKIGSAPENCFVLEDSGNGIRAGNAAGMKCIGIPDVADFDEDAKSKMVLEANDMLEVIDFLKEQM